MDWIKYSPYSTLVKHMHELIKHSYHRKYNNYNSLTYYTNFVISWNLFSTTAVTRRENNFHYICAGFLMHKKHRLVSFFLNN